MSKTNAKFFIAVAAVIALIGFVALKPSQKSEEISDNTLVVGLNSGYLPFEFMDPQGHLAGFDIDIAGRIAEKIGKTLVLKDMDFDGEILSLKQGKIDLIISGLNITPSRLKEIDMIPYHGEDLTSLSLIFWENLPSEIHTTEDLKKLPHFIVSVQSGSVPENYLSGHPEIQVKSLQGALEPLMDVKYGKSTAHLVEPDVAEYLQKQHPEIKIVNIPLSKTDQVLGFGIGIQKGNHELFQEVEQAIHELKSSGELKQLEDKWFKGET